MGIPKTPSLGSAGGILVFALGTLVIIWGLSQFDATRRIMGIGSKGMWTQGGTS